MSTGSAYANSSSHHLAGSRAGYVDVDRIENSSGLVCVISQRRRSGALTFAIFRVFEREGQPERTSFIPESLAALYRDTLEIAIDRMAKLRREGKLPFPVHEDKPT